MKNAILITFLMLKGFLVAQNVAFTDPVLKQFFLATNATTHQYAQADVNSSNYVAVDANGDGEIQVIEALSIKFIFFDNYNEFTNDVWFISSINDLTAFKNLEWIYCPSKPLITSLTLNNLQFLRDLAVGNCPITTVNLSNLPNLKYLFLSSCELTTLDVSGLPKLTSVDISNNNFSSINLSNNPLLEFFSCDNNNFSSVNFSSNVLLEGVYCKNNLFSTLNFSQFPKFRYLYCANNPNLTSINIKNGRVHYYEPSIPIDSVDWKEGNPNLTSICVDANEQSIVQTLLNNDTINVLPNLVVSSTCNFLDNVAFIDEQFVVSPNPSNDIFNIDLKNQSEKFQKLEVCDILGKIVYSQNIDNQLQIALNLSTLQSGCYFAKLMNDEKNVTIKLLKN